MPQLFLAFPVDEDTRKALQAWQGLLPTALAGVRWLHAADWHITALFIGNVDDSTASRIEQELSSFTHQPPPTLGFDKTTTILRHKKPVMWWARYQATPDWQAFYQALYRCVSAFTPLEPYRSNAIPHITLARLKSGNQPFPDLPEAENMPLFPLRNLQMFESQQQPSGTRYRPLYTVTTYPY